MIDNLPADFRPDSNVEIHKMDSSFVWSEDNIFFIHSMPDIDHTLEHAKRQFEFYRNTYLSEIRPKLPMICDVRIARPIKKEVRDFYSSKFVGGHTTRFAFLVDSPVSMVIANFFISVQKLSVPVRMFTKPNDAIIWCKQN
ncbi:MAG TPA: hypothetical protein DCF89_12245 [Flavobacteriales bacterium]|nr:hypothetical protein [Crocinitomicaceae bacterium]HAE31878.1 hypothetical protein [Flavobacteriales bacterium]